MSPAALAVLLRQQAAVNLAVAEALESTDATPAANDTHVGGYYYSDDNPIGARKAFVAASKRLGFDLLKLGRRLAARRADVDEAIRLRGVAPKREAPIDPEAAAEAAALAPRRVRKAGAK